MVKIFNNQQILIELELTITLKVIEIIQETLPNITKIIQIAKKFLKIHFIKNLFLLQRKSENSYRKKQKTV